MSHPTGTYLGGIRTVEDLRQRSRIDPDTGCWHWGMAVTDGSPKVCLIVDGVRTACRGRKAALLLAGKSVPKGHIVFARPVCHSTDCVNPEHSRSGSRNDHGRHLRSTGATRTHAKQSAARRVARAKLATKLNPAMAREIRASEEPTSVLSARYGVAASWVNTVRKGLGWRELHAGASIFDHGQPAKEPA